MGNSLLIKNGTLALDGREVRADLEIEDGRIKRIDAVIEDFSGDEVFDASDHLVLPGFIDIHTHGGCGYDMNGITPDQLETLCKFYAAHGVTGVLPTLLSDSRDRLMDYLTTLARGQETIHTGAEILGIHLEGPYLAREYKGAMPEALLQKPSLDDLATYQRVSSGALRLMTVSPEVEGALEFISAATRVGVRISIGHSGADYDVAWAAIHRGAASSTHTFNGMKLPHQHFPAIGGAVLESDIYAEVICDGRHLHPGMVRILLKTKSWERIIAVTDSISASGLGDGAYMLGVNPIVVKDGDARLADGSSRAGSTLTADQAFRNLLAYTGESPAKVSWLLSRNPARMLGLDNKKGTLSVGKDADLIIMTRDYQMVATFVEGQKRF
ncbi:MAG: N-acetylglucosamine-6-phosphate deacetylase [Angelakisella sp.]